MVLQIKTWKHFSYLVILYLKFHGNKEETCGINLKARDTSVCSEDSAVSSASSPGSSRLMPVIISQWPVADSSGDQETETQTMECNDEELA